MEYILLFFFAWTAVCLPALIFTAVANSRRRREITELTEKITALTRQLENLEHRSHTDAATPPQAIADLPIVAPAVRISAEETRPAPAAPAAVPIPAMREPLPAEKPAATTAVPPPPHVQAPPIAAQTNTEAKPIPIGGIPPAPKPHVAAEAPSTATAPSISKPAPLTPLPAASPTQLPLGSSPESATPMAASTTFTQQQPMRNMAASSAHVPPPAGSPSSAHASILQSLQPQRKRGTSWEEMIGADWLPKIGITAVVIGVGYLVAHAWGSFGPWLRVAIVYFGGLALLAGGILLERKERYRTLGRSLIGGGWAVIVLVTYGLRHAPFMAILSSNAVDLLLLLGVVAAMVWHTLKYNSQLVTGAGFLLGFAAITLNPDPPYNLIAGALLVAGMTVIVQRYRWWELEIFGILASYLNHFYWLYSIFGLQTTRAAFPHHTISVLLMIAYWVVFRCSYVWRKVSSHEEESVSTIAGLLNPLLFLGIMKYQSFHPEWAFYALLAMGAAEFVLGQLPASRRRVAPFRVLSSLGATLMIAAIPFKYSGDSLELLWLAGAEAFLLAGVFTRERLFRGFGLMISALIVLYALPVRVAPLIQELTNGQAHYHPNISIVLSVIAAVIYANSHVVGRRWQELFQEDLETRAMQVLSFVASLFAVCAVYAVINDNAVAIVLALFVAALCWFGRQFAISELVYQAHWIAVVAFAQAISTGRTLDAVWHGVPERILTFVPIAALFYLSSRFVRLSKTRMETLFASVYAWAATALLAILIWFQSPDWSMPVLWIALALGLSLFGGALKRVDFKWQAFTLVLLAFGRAVAVNFDLISTFHHLTYRLISVSLIAAGIYLLTRWAPHARIKPIYSMLGTFLLAFLALKETPEPWIAVAWISLAAVLALAARFWKDRALLWQTHVLSLLAVAWTLYASFASQYRGGHVQLISVTITAAVLYALNWATNVAPIIEDERISQAYSWAGSLLLSWLLWYQLQPVNVTLAWGVFGLLLFELGNWRSWPFLRAQGYVALACSFAHIFYANFNVLRTPGSFDLSIITVCLLVPIYFWVYWQLHGKQTASAVENKMRVDDLIACLGTATLVALARFELPLENVVIGYAAILFGALLIAWRTRLQIFLYQALVVLGMTAFRISMYNFYHLREPFSSNLSAAAWAIALMGASVPICLAIRRRNAEPVAGKGWLTFLARRPEQPAFFVPFVLLAVLLALKVVPGMITLAWGVQAVVVFVLALWAKERNFRLAGLGLLLVCAAKVVFWDVWQLHDLARILTLIGIGGLMFVVSFLFSKNRETLREYL
jgi:Predicted membrane protein (DUF2339)